MLKRLHLRLNEQGLIDLQNLDDRLNRSTRNPSLVTRRKKGGPDEPDEPDDHDLDCSRGGLTTKISMHLRC